MGSLILPGGPPVTTGQGGGNPALQQPTGLSGGVDQILSVSAETFLTQAGVWVRADATAAGFQTHLPDVVAAKGQRVGLIKVDATNHTAFLDTGPSFTVPLNSAQFGVGENLFLLTTQWATVVVESNGVSWDVIAQFTMPQLFTEAVSIVGPATVNIEPVSQALPVDATLGDVVLTLPLTTLCLGCVVAAVRLDGSGDNLTFATSGSETFSTSGSTYLLNGEGATILFIPVKGVWMVIGGGAGSVAWSSITGTPTTLAGYGITDAVPLNPPAGNPTLNVASSLAFSQRIGIGFNPSAQSVLGTGNPNTSCGWGYTVLQGGDSTGFNVAIGYGCASAGSSNGGYNVILGFSAASGNPVGTFNVCVGADAGSRMGDNNTFIGGRAGIANGGLTGSNNVAIGFYSGYYSAGSNLYFVNNQDRGSAAAEVTNSLVYGVFASTPASQLYRINAPIQFGGPQTTGAGTALLGANCPASALSAPYQWVDVLAEDGTECVMPMWAL